MDRYEFENAVELVDGYYSKPLNQDVRAEFERARTECIKNLLKRIENVKELTFIQFEKSKSRGK